MSIEVPEKVQQWFESQNFGVRLFPEEAVKKFKSLSLLHDFVAKEELFWQPIDQHIFSRFNQVRGIILSAIDKNANESQFLQRLNNAFDLLKSVNVNVRAGEYIVFSDTNLAVELKKAADRYGANKRGYQTFLQGVFSDSVYMNRTPWVTEEFFGLFDAYLYERLNERVHEQIKNGETALSEVQSKFSVFFDQCDEQKSKTQKQFDDFCQKYLDWKSQSEASFNGSTSHQLKKQQDQFDDQEKMWRKRIADLEELYQKKLMLESPVQYWTDLEIKHRKAGCRFAWATAVSLVIMASVLSAILYNWPPKCLASEALSWNSLKGSILLLTIASLAIYVVRFLAKFAISSYHLARDAEERKQLTYVYLSLLQKNAVAPEQQQIVLQALFSRVDTGLLKGDHGPTMPSALSNIMGNQG